MATVYIPKEYSELADRFARNQVSATGKVTFTTFMHLFVLAAMIGRKEGVRSEIRGKERGPEIYEEIFARNNLDSVAYLLALQEQKTGDVLREKHDVEIWKIFEEYSASGFRILNDWLIENPTDVDGLETLLTRMKLAAAEITRSADDETAVDVEF